MAPWWEACQSSDREGQSRGKHPPADTVDKALWRTWAGQQPGSYTKASNPSSGSSPGRPAPWLFHMHVSHASSLSPASAASSTPGEEGDIRSGMARTEGHWTLPHMAVSGHQPTALQGLLLPQLAAREPLASPECNAAAEDGSGQTGAWGKDKPQRAQRCQLQGDPS